MPVNTLGIRYSTVAFTIVILTILSAMTFYTVRPEARPSTFTLELDDRFLEAFGMDDYVVAAAILVIPGVESQQPTLEEDGRNLRIQFQVPASAWEAGKRLSHNGMLVTPSITLVLTDYEDNETLNVIIPSTYMLSVHEGIDDIDRIMQELYEDPLKAVRIGELRLTDSDARELEELGLAVKTHNAFEDELPLFPWETSIRSLSQCGFDEHVGSGIYYSVNTMHPAYNEPLPEWWEERISADTSSLVYASWERFRNYLVTSLYYVPEEMDLNDALQVISNYIYHTSDGVSVISQIDMGTLVARLTNSNPESISWNDSLPASEPAYEGFIPIFKYRIDNAVHTDNSKNSMVFDVNIAEAQASGVISGLMVNGFFFTGTPSTSITMTGFFDVHNAESMTRTIAFYGEVYSTGDYAVIIWKRLGTLACGDERYVVIAPHTILLPLYTVYIYYDDNFMYVATNETIEGPGLLANAGASVLIDIEYGPDNYQGAYTEIYEFSLPNNDSGMQFGYNSLIGSPVLNITTTVFGLTAADSPYARVAATLAEYILNTGYFSASYTGSAVLVDIRILQAPIPPTDNYSINVVNLVPKTLDGTPGVDGLTWNEVQFSITKANLSSPS